MESQVVRANVASSSSTVSVTAAMGSAGQALASTPSSSIDLVVGSLGGPVEYKVGNGAWQALDRQQMINILVDLSVTTVLLRKLTTTAAAIPVSLVVNAIGANQAGEYRLPTVVLGTTAPSNSDGRPDGTVYIQTA